MRDSRNYYYKSDRRNYPRLINLIPIPAHMEVIAVYREDGIETCSEPVLYTGIFENGSCEFLTASPDGELDQPRQTSNFSRFIIKDLRKRG
jgi:hypothetical protein